LSQCPVKWVVGLFLGSKPAEAWRWPPTPFIAEVKERVELFSTSLVGLHGLF
jgi:hypothetical protein